VYEWLIVIGLGLVGGLLRIAISGAFVRPQSDTDENENRVYRFGSLGAIVVGGAAGFVAWALATNSIFTDQGVQYRPIALTILAGVAGAEILLNYVNQQFGVAASQQQANQETGDIAGPLSRAQENLTEQLSECQKREQELREEVDRLKQDGTS
jgi:hypothetical protein